jgi:hypothetical protein
LGLVIHPDKLPGNPGEMTARYGQLLRMTMPPDGKIHGLFLASAV